MPTRMQTRPPFVRTILDDLRIVGRLIFIDFIGSLILWPIIFLISILFIPPTLLLKRLLLHCSLPCTCKLCCRCSCRQFASATESSWIGAKDKLASYRVVKERILQWSNERSKAKAAEHIEATEQPLMSPDTPQSSEEPSYGRITTNIHSLVIVVERTLDLDKFLDLIQKRMINLTTPAKIGRYFPRFTQCLVRLPGGSLVWVDDPSFALSRHIMEHQESISEQAHLERLLQAKSKEGLASDRPLWQLIISKDYGSSKDVVLLLRFHGSMYDGITIAKILAYAVGNPPNFIFTPRGQYFLYKSHILKFILTGPIRLLRFYMRRRRQPLTNEDCKPNNGIIHQYSWSERTLNMSLLIKNKMLLKMAFNEMLLSMVTGALRGYHPTKDGEIDPTSVCTLPSNSKVLVPFDLWTNLTKRKTLPQGNHLTLLPCPISDVPEVIPRLWGTAGHFSKLTKSGDTRSQLFLMNWLNLLPFSHSLRRCLHRRIHHECSLLFTSFNGPVAIETVAGSDVRDIMFFTYPPDNIQSSLNFISYSGTIKLTTMSRLELSSDIVNEAVANMADQLVEINRMVFQRYFPEGFNQDYCPYLRPQSSSFFTEFIAKLQHLDALSGGAYPMSVSESPQIGASVSGVRFRETDTNCDPFPLSPDDEEVLHSKDSIRQMASDDREQVNPSGLANPVSTEIEIEMGQINVGEMALEVSSEKLTTEPLTEDLTLKNELAHAASSIGGQ
ncbi:uncharacterized protein [Watersipora subatra]|uniref:uncharacterized protein n=1 Tax=Watersipora subatra TaxID=2589382 RepID=UPI00355BFB55